MGKINKNIVKMLVPIIFSNIITSLGLFLDTIMVSRANPMYLAGVGIATPILITLMIVFAAITDGVTTLMSVSKGEQNQGKAMKVLKNGNIILISLAVLTVIIIYPNMNSLLTFMGAKEGTVDFTFAKQYFAILLLGLIPNVMGNCLRKSFLAVGETKKVFSLSLLGLIVDVVFNYLLIFGKLGFPKMGIAGAALSTVMGYLVDCIVGLYFIYSRKKQTFLKATAKDHKTGLLGIFDLDIIKKIFKIGAPVILERSGIRFGIMIITRLIILLGTNAIIAHQIMGNLAHIPFILATSFSAAAATTSGICLGEKKYNNVKTYTKQITKLSLASSLVIVGILYFFGKNIISFYDNDINIITTTYAILLSYLLVIPVQAVSNTISGSFRGLGITAPIAVVTIITIGIIRPTVTYFFIAKLGLGLAGFWYGVLVEEITRLIMLAAIYLLNLKRITEKEQCGLAPEV